MAMGAGNGDGDVAPLRVEGGEIDMVTEFTYLGSCLCNDGEVTREVAYRIAKASKAFGISSVMLFL